MVLPTKFSVGVATLILSFSVQAEDALSELDFAFGVIETTDVSTGPDHWRGFLGAGNIVRDDTVAERRAYGLLMVSISYQDTVYFRIGQAGVWLLKSPDSAARVGVAVRARSGYDPDNIDGLAGMEKRDTSIEAGIKGVWRTRPVTATFGIYTDVSDNSNGNSAQLSFSHSFRLNEQWALVPSIGAEWLSSKVVGYYYGVRPNETTPSRPAYAGESSLNLRAALLAHYKITQAWFLYGGASLTHLGSGITDSPISTQDYLLAVFAGGGWRF